MDNFYLIDTNNALKSIDEQLSSLLDVADSLAHIDDRLSDLVEAINNLTDKLENK